MKIKIMLGLVALSLLASCGLIKSPAINLITKDTGNTVTSGGAIGINGKGATIDLIRGGLTIQAATPVSQTITGSFPDSIVSAEATQYLDRLDEWGASQDIGFINTATPDATLIAAAGTTCPANFEVSSLSADLNITSGTNIIDQNFPISGILVFQQVGTSCNYKISVKSDTSGKKPSIEMKLSGDKTKVLKLVLKDGIANSVSVKLNLTYDNAIVKGSLTLFMGTSSAYVIGIIL